MHADRLVRKRKAQHAALQAREPALINLPIPIPSDIPLLSPIINPLIAGIPASEFPLPIQSWPPLLSFPPLPGHTTKTAAQPGTPPATPPPAQPTATNAPVPTAAPQQPPTGVSPPNNSPPSGNDGGGSQSSPSGGSGNGGGSGEGSAGQGSGGGSPSGGGSGGSGGDGQATGGPSSSNSGPSAVVNGTVIILPSGIVTSLGASITWSTDAGGRTFANGLPIPTQNAAVNVGSNPPTGTGSGSDNVAPGSSPSVTYAGHGSHATGTSGQAGSGTSPGGNGSGGGDDPSGDDPTTPGPGGTAGASHKPFPQAAIIALAVIGAIAFLAVIVICCRRSARARRIARRKLWFNGEKHASMYGAVSSSGYFRENDVRSSYATSYEQHTDPFRLSGPPVPLGSDWPLYRSEMSQAANVPQVTIPTPLIVNCKPPSPTVRSESRPNSMGSDISNPFDDTAQPGQVLLVPERSLISPDIPGTPLSVRPFSPSERWSFPMPPSSQRASSQFPPRTSSASPDTFNTVYTSDYQTANDLENPFADFDGSDAGHTSETYITADSDAAAHFSHVEVVYRPFDPERSDEICVDQGDRVRVLKRFEDGWAFAENYTSGQRGLFPIDCLRQPGQELPAFLAAKRLSSYTSASSARLSVMKDNAVV